MSTYYEQQWKKFIGFCKKVYEYARINNSVYGCGKDCVVTTDEENSKIVPQKGEINKTVSFFYHTYKGDGAIQPRTKRLYTSISIKRIQK